MRGRQISQVAPKATGTEKCSCSHFEIVSNCSDLFPVSTNFSEESYCKEKPGSWFKINFGDGCTIYTVNIIQIKYSSLNSIQLSWANAVVLMENILHLVVVVHYKGLLKVRGYSLILGLHFCFNSAGKLERVWWRIPSFLHKDPSLERTTYLLPILVSPN